MPKVYVIEDGAMNAFATGRDPNHAAVAVTRGLMNKLDRLELEGVIAHELSHIGNRDTMLMTTVVVLVGIIAMLADISLRLTRFGAGTRRGYRGKNGGIVVVILLLCALVAVVLAPIAARLIAAAVSRQREFLADASGALLTRYPEGLARALEKIRGDPDPLDSATKATEHLFIVNPLTDHSSFLNNLFSTHPPIEDRIQLLRAM
jgi:heat shock protein HtpX